MTAGHVDKAQAQAQIDCFLATKKRLLDIQSETLDECVRVLVESGYCQDDRLDELLHLLLTVIDARPRSIELYVNLIQKLCAGTPGFVTTLKEFLLSTRERKVRRCILIHRLWTAGVIPLGDVMKFIDDMMRDKAFQFMKVHRKLALGLFCWFAPEIEREGDKFVEYFEKVKDSHNSPYFRTLANLNVPFLSQLDALRSENWALHRKAVVVAGSMDPIAVAIRGDEVFETSDWSACVEPTVFECCNFLNHRPSLLQYAAFHGAVKTFKLILEHGGDAGYLDAKKRGLEEYAIAGGNPEIIDLVFAKPDPCGSPLEDGHSPLASPLAGPQDGDSSPLAGLQDGDASPLAQAGDASPLAGAALADGGGDEDQVVVSGHRKVGSKRSLARDIGAERTFSGAVQRRRAKKAPASPMVAPSTESHLTEQSDSYSNLTVAKFHRFGVIPPKAGTAEFLRCCKSNCLELLVYCVEHGVNPNTTDEKTKTPGLPIACQYGCLEVVRFLSTCEGIDLSIIDGTGVCFVFMEPHLCVLLLTVGCRSSST